MKWHGRLFLGLERFWLNIRRFAFNNRSIFELALILIYAVEQLGLVWFTSRAANAQELSFIISIFIVIFLTTFAIHKIVMESRIKFLEQELTGVNKDKSELELKFSHLTSKHEELRSSYKNYVTVQAYKYLNNDKQTGRKERGG